MPLPHDYTERVYAGVLGKLIGVYLGRPFESWPYKQIMQELGEINYYVHEKMGVPLVVTDDDVSGTFTFLRALTDYGNGLDLTPEQIGQTWLNYIIEERTILWWGGMGNSTEHTAYLRLKKGIPAPRSGSMALNGKVVAEQIGSQIFIDGWAMVAPGNPELAADLARRAASVSHDGEAIYGAQVLAAMEAQAFIESDIHKLIDVGLSVIPQDCLIRNLINDIREWHAGEPDWRVARAKIEANYGYDKYGGNCHMIPNHGLIIHALLYGNDDFQKSLMIVNTSGWDTDCNSGNVGCLLGIKNGLAAIESGPDFRGPVADRLYLPTADGGRAVSDAVTESYRVINMGRALAGATPLVPKQGARFHFELPGSVQGFLPDESVDAKGVLSLQNVVGQSTVGTRSLALRYQGLTTGRVARAGSPVFTPSKEVADYFEKRGYALLASPALYPGQTVRAAVSADASNPSSVHCNLYLRRYTAPDDALELVRGPQITLQPGADHTFVWPIEGKGCEPIAEVGVEIHSAARTEGSLYLDYLTWAGAPDVVFTRPEPGTRQQRWAPGAQMWRRAWVKGVDGHDLWWPEAFRVVQNEGRGLLITGTREWTNYTVSAAITPHMAKTAGIAARVQGMRRFYALLLCDDQKVRLVKALDGDSVLAEQAFPWQFGETHKLTLQVVGQRLRGFVNDVPVFAVDDNERPLTGGGIALVIEDGRLATDAVSVRPA